MSTQSPTVFHVGVCGHVCVCLHACVRERECVCVYDTSVSVCVCGSIRFTSKRERERPVLLSLIHVL